MPKIIEGKLSAEGKKFAIVASRYNDFITEKLVGGALHALNRCGAKDKDIEVFKVPIYWHWEMQSWLARFIGGTPIEKPAFESD